MGLGIPALIEKPQISPLRFATHCRKTFPGKVRGTADPSASPDFLSRVVASVNCMWFSLGENHKSGAGQSCEVGKSGYARDDKGKGDGSIESRCWTEAFSAETAFRREVALSFVIPSEAKGSAVFSTVRSGAEWRDLRFPIGPRACVI